MKIFLVYNWYGYSYNSGLPRMEDIEAVFVGEDTEEKCKKYVNDHNNNEGGGYDYKEITVADTNLVFGELFKSKINK